jgi:ribose 1,5-bisphosphokinase
MIAYRPSEVSPSVGNGVFVAIVGPSGAGKDSILRAAAQKLANHHDIIFVRRVVTRSSDQNEDHDTTDPESFAAMELSGAFALSWSANGLQYGLPVDLLDALADNRIVVANLSRDSVAAVRQRFANVMVVHVTAAIDLLRERLAQRGREDSDDRDLRIARSLMRDQNVQADIRIENNGALEEAVESFSKLLLALRTRLKALA